jgi:pimeloyl-ACP methyl ester carboxylesterase
MPEDPLHFAWNELDLAGTLRVPDRAESHPVVVMLQGSGPADRTSDGYFTQIQDAFLARGIGTFSFDKPGCGESTGDWREYALEARADQVVAALEAVQAHPIVRDGCVGIWGQSQGGWLVQMLASTIADLPFAVANSGPSINVAEQNLFGCEHAMRAEGSSESEIELALEFLEDPHRAALIGSSYEDVEAQSLKSARDQPWYGYMTVTDAEDWQGVLSFVREGYEPLLALEGIRTPFMAIYGERDVLLPAWRSAQESGDALGRAGNPDATVVVFPGGDHRIQDATTGGFVDGYLDLLVDWVVHRVPESQERARYPRSQQ